MVQGSPVTLRPRGTSLTTVESVGLALGADTALRCGADPEAALSPQSQRAFLSMVKDAVDAGSRFLIATHAPILMATPGAATLSFDETPVRAVAFEDLAAVNLARDFLVAPARFLRDIWRTS